jgi:hypothetical protein
MLIDVRPAYPAFRSSSQIRDTRVANSKRKRDAKILSARPRTEKDEVSHPRVEGKTEFVDRVSDTLTSMFNRKQISQLQFGAGDRYRLAYEMQFASAGGSMDFERARGSTGTAPVSPALTFLLAAECTREAKTKLYPKDFAIVHRVCVIGLTIEAAARQLYHPEYDGDWPPYVRNAGMRFRAGLDALADMWWPDSRAPIDRKTGEEVRPIRGAMTDKAAVTDAPPPDVGASRVAHATRDKVYRGPQRRERA